MTVSLNKRIITHTGNDAATSWPYDFEIPDADYAVVRVKDTTTGVITEISSANYTITGVGNVGGGSVEYPLAGSPLSATEEISIARTVPYLQGLNITNQGGFHPETLEDELDLIVMQIQTLAYRAGKAIQLTEFDDLTDVDEFVEQVQMLGPFSKKFVDPAASDPTTRNDGSALQAGDIYFNTVEDALKVYDGSVWLIVSEATLASEITNDSSVSGTSVADALDNLDADIAGLSSVYESIGLLAGITAEAGASLNLDSTHIGQLVRMTSGSANAATIQSDANGSFSGDAWITVQQAGAGVTTITAAAGVTLNGVSAGSVALPNQWATIMLVRVGTDAWTINIEGVA